VQDETKQPEVETKATEAAPVTPAAKEEVDFLAGVTACGLAPGECESCT